MNNKLNEDIKTLNELKIVFEYYNIKLEKKGKNYVCCCPFHDDNNPSMNLTEKDGVGLYHCFGCGKGGDIINFVMKKENLNHIEATKKAHEILGKEFNISHLEFNQEKYTKKKQIEKLEEKQNKSTDINEIIKLEEEILNIEDSNFKIYGNYTYSNKSNKLFKIIEKIDKDGEIEEHHIKIYDGNLRVLGSSVDLDNDIESFILESTITNKTITEIQAGYILGSKNKFLETINSKKGFKVIPDSKIQSYIQNYLYEQYLGLDEEGKLQNKYVTEKIGFQNDFFIYPNYRCSFDNKHYYKEHGKYNSIFQYQGLIDHWINYILIPSTKSDNLKTMILGTFASILIEPLGVHENFIIECSGDTGTSKTTALNVCASIFGKPENYITDWNTTKTALISNASELNVFPLILDDTKKCEDKEIIPGVVYALSGGKDKARANTDGSLKETKKFKNITISSGEVPLSDYLKNGNVGRGAYARFISLDGGVFENNDANKEIADKLNFYTQKYYGAVGYEFCKWFNEQIQDNDYLEGLKDIYLNQLIECSSQCTEELAIRRANHIALLKVTGIVLQNFFKHDYFEYDTLVQKLLKQNELTVIETDNIKEAYIRLMEYCNKNHMRFYSDENPIIQSPIGQYQTMRNKEKNEVYVFYEQKDVENIISEYGDRTDLLRNFRKRNYILTDTSNKRFTKNIKHLVTKKSTRALIINIDPYRKAL